MADDQTRLQGSCIGSNPEALSGATAKKLTNSELKSQVLNDDKCNSESLVKPAKNSDARGDTARGARLLAPSQEGGCCLEPTNKGTKRMDTALSSNGKTADFESANRGSNPRGASTRPKGWSKRKWKNWKYQRKFQAKASAKQRVYMVFREGGDLPTVTYSNMGKALGDATALAKKHRGEQFHVLTSTIVVSRPALAAAAREGGDVKQAPFMGSGNSSKRRSQ